MPPPGADTTNTLECEDADALSTELSAAAICRAACRRLARTFPTGSHRISDMRGTDVRRAVLFAEATYSDVVSATGRSPQASTFVADAVVRQFRSYARHLTTSPGSPYLGAPLLTIQALVFAELATCYPRVRRLSAELSSLVARVDAASRAPVASGDVEAASKHMRDLWWRAGALATLASALVCVDPDRMAAAGFARAKDGAGFVHVASCTIHPDSRRHSDADATSGLAEAVGGVICMGALIYIMWVCEMQHVERALSQMQSAPDNAPQVRADTNHNTCPADEGTCACRLPAQEWTDRDGFGVYGAALGVSALALGVIWAFKRRRGR